MFYFKRSLAKLLRYISQLLCTKDLEQGLVQLGKNSAIKWSSSFQKENEKNKTKQN